MISTQEEDMEFIKMIFSYKVTIGVIMMLVATWYQFGFLPAFLAAGFILILTGAFDWLRKGEI